MLPSPLDFVTCFVLFCLHIYVQPRVKQKAPPTRSPRKRCIIGARCEPLERMLEGPMKEAWAAEGSIPLPNHRHAVFLAFLEFLYTDKVLDEMKHVVYKAAILMYCCFYPL